MILKKITKMCKISKSSKLNFFWTNFWKMLNTFRQKFDFRAVQKCANLVDLEKCCKMIIWWPKSVSIQPRTSLGKSDVSGRRTSPRARSRDFALSFRGSFSAVSTPMFTTKYAFCSIFQNLQNYLAEFSKSCKIENLFFDKNQRIS